VKTWTWRWKLCRGVR